MRNLISDIRYGVRMLFKQPGFSLAAIVVLALGIGGSTAMFSIVDALVLKPLLIEKADQIVGCFSRDTQRPDSYRGFSYPNYADLRADNGVFSSLAAHNMALVGIKEGDTTRRAFSDVVTANYFETLGVPLFRGRTFTPEEEQPGSGIPSLIVSYSIWRKTGADPDLLGKTRQINGRIFTIVGITAKGFTGTNAMISPEMYVPMGMYESVVNDFDGHGKKLASRDNHALIVIGRLKEGMTQQAADASLAVVADRMALAYPGENKDQTFMVHTLSRNNISTNPPHGNEAAFPAILVISMAGVVLLIASLNVANMMLVRGAARRKEIAIRQSLGAKRGSILQQLLIEGLILAFIGGAAGLALAAGWEFGVDAIDGAVGAGRSGVQRIAGFACVAGDDGILRIQRDHLQPGTGAQRFESEHRDLAEERRDAGESRHGLGQVFAAQFDGGRANRAFVDAAHGGGFVYPQREDDTGSGAGLSHREFHAD